jgi:hypothetical protein
MRTLPLGVAVLVLSSLLSVAAAEREVRWYWYDPDDSAAFAEALTDRGVPFRRDADGGIWYPISKTQTVDEVIAIVRGRCSPSVRYEDPRDMASLMDHLRHENIPFITCRRNGREYVKWDPAFEARVDQIQELVDDESMRQSREERQRTRIGK